MSKTRKNFHRVEWMAVLVAIVSSCVIIAYASDEIAVTIGLEAEKGEYKYKRTVSKLQRDMTGDNAAGGILYVQTGAWEQVTIPSDVATNGWAFFRNVTTDTWMSVDIGVQVVTTNSDASSTTNYKSFIRLNAKDVFVSRLHPTNTIWTTANATGACSGVNLEWQVTED